MARETITQRIALEGGKAIKAEMEAIGVAGKKAFNDLTDAAKASLTISNIGKAFDSIKKKATEVGGAFSELGGSINTLGTNIARSARNMGIMVASISAAVVGIGLLFKNAANASDELEDMAQALGLTAEKFQELSFAFGQTGVSQDKFVKGMVKFNKALDEAGNADRELAKKHAALNREFQLGRINVTEYNAKLADARFEAGQATNLFTRLGITIERNADGTTNNEKALLDLADAFAKGLPEGISKSTVALQLFGKGSQDMVERLSEGRKGFALSRIEMERLAPPMDRLAIAAGDRLSRAFETLGRAQESARQAALAVFFPVVTRVVNALTEAIAANRTGLILFAADIASKVTPIVDDLIALLQGRDVDVKNNFIIEARNSVRDFASAVKTAFTNIIIPAVKGLMAALQGLAVALNTMFGTEFTGGQLAAALAITKLIGLFGVLRASIGVIIALIKVLVVTFGGVTVVLAAIAFALGFLLVEAFNHLGGLQGIWTTVWNAIQAISLGVLTAITNAIRLVGEFFISVWNAIKTAADTVWSAIVSAFQSAVASITGFFTSLRDSILSVFDSIIAAAKQVASAIASAMGSGGESPGLAQGGQAFAGGGRVRGPGTSTSDSIWARLSNGEFVQRTAAVKKYGLDFMNALNRGLLSADSVRSLMRGFNMGGLVDGLLPPIPRYADGGLVAASISGGGGRPLILNIDGESVRGLTANGSAERQLSRLASKSSIRSGGRKPIWFGGG